MKLSYDHLHMRCLELNKTLEYYQRLFGGRELARFEVGGRQIVKMDVGGLVLSFSPLDDNGGEDPHGASKSRLGAYELGFEVEDLESACRELADKGAEIIMGPLQARPGVKIAFIRGPDCMQIELVQRD